MFNKKNLPSRSVIAFVFIPAITVMGLWYITNKPAPINVEALKTEAVSKALNSGIGEYNERDTDGDLLKDWEEFLYETNINLVDTDGDGLDDYQEVLDPIRDPNVADAEKGRYQASSTDEFATTTPFYTEDPNLNATEIFARDIMTSFVQLQRADAFRTSVQDTVVRKVAETAIDRDKREQRINLEDLTVSNDITIIDKQEYKKAYIQATVQLNPVREHDYVLLGFYTETEDLDYLRQIETNANAYGAFAEALKSISIPKDVTMIHLEVINNFYYMIDSMKLMATADVDPLGALVAANKYREDEKALEISLQALAFYFSKID